MEESYMAIKCSKCGTELPDGAVFCYNCGQSVQMTPKSNTSKTAQTKNTPAAQKFPTAKNTTSHTSALTTIAAAKSFGTKLKSKASMKTTQKNSTTKSNV